MKGTYEVIVGDIGSVRSEVGKKEAVKVFNEYKSQSQDGYGRAAGEDVTVFHNGEIVKEYIGELSQKEEE